MHDCYMAAVAGDRGDQCHGRSGLGSANFWVRLGSRGQSELCPVYPSTADIPAAVALFGSGPK